MKIQSFKQLEAWKSAHQLTLTIYKITNTFPSEEKFGLTNQLRRSSVSIESNIAEGFARKSQKEKRQFYYMAISSLSEVDCQIEISKDLQYINQETYQEISDLIINSQKIINGLIRSLLNYQAR